MKIKKVEPFILHVPVTGPRIADSTHRITHWGVVGARVDITEPADVVDGFFRLPQLPGAGTAPTPQAWDRLRQPAA